MYYVYGFMHKHSYLARSRINQPCPWASPHFTVLVLVFVVYNRRREAHIKYPGPDDDVRENIINYDDEGGGEDDMTAFDITPLQIPIGGPMPPELAPMKMPIMCKYLSESERQIKRDSKCFSFTIFQRFNQFNYQLN